jgi:hypothetical protein
MKNTDKVNGKLKSLNGRLTTLIQNISLLNELINSPLISKSQEYRRCKENISNIIKDARKSGYDWMFSESDIYLEEDGGVRLPSVEIAEYFVESGDHHDLKKFFHKNGIGQGIIWDVEYSAWYPIFDTVDNAKKFIKDLNELFDKTYFKK